MGQGHNWSTTHAYWTQKCFRLKDTFMQDLKRSGRSISISITFRNVLTRWLRSCGSQPLLCHPVVRQGTSAVYLQWDRFGLPPGVTRNQLKWGATSDLESYSEQRYSLPCYWPELWSSTLEQVWRAKWPPVVGDLSTLGCELTLKFLSIFDTRKTVTDEAWDGLQCSLIYPVFDILFKFYFW